MTNMNRVSGCGETRWPWRRPRESKSSRGSAWARMPRDIILFHTSMSENAAWYWSSYKSAEISHKFLARMLHDTDRSMFGNVALLLLKDATILLMFGNAGKIYWSARMPQFGSSLRAEINHGIIYYQKCSLPGEWVTKSTIFVVSAS